METINVHDRPALQTRGWKLNPFLQLHRFLGWGGFFGFFSPSSSITQRASSFTGASCPDLVLPLTHPTGMHMEGARAGFPAGRPPARDRPPSADGKGHYKASDGPKTPPPDPAVGKALGDSALLFLPRHGYLPLAPGTQFGKIRANSQNPNIFVQKQRPSSHGENSAARGTSSVCLKLGFIFTKYKVFPDRSRRTAPAPLGAAQAEEPLILGWVGAPQRRPRACSRQTSPGNFDRSRREAGHCRGCRGAVPPQPAARPPPARLTPSSPLPEPRSSRALPAVRNNHLLLRFPIFGALSL